jgi:large subunit ribosomal protein L1
MPKHGKRYRAGAENVDPDAKYELKEALGLATAVRSEKFDESLDVAVRLSVDPRKADQNIRGSLIVWWPLPI